MINYVQEENLNYTIVHNSDEARVLYQKEKPTWIIFGNAFSDLKTIHLHTKTALMQHGIGPKSCYYDVSESEITYRFVEGNHRLQRLQKRFPNKKFLDTGYAKLDPIINQTSESLDLIKLGLDPKKQTILYAPTFYPSSIECLPSNFPELVKQYNLIVKPHYFSLIKGQYKHQRKHFEQWKKFTNIYISSIEEVSIISFMNTADLLISDASSTLFEFIALNKPAIWCDFYKLRWTYRGILSWRLNKRLDSDLKYFSKVARQVKTVEQLITEINNQIQSPKSKELDRLEMTEFLAGKVDGKCSERITNFITSDILT
jgi:CDP-glycerol glycerophosphotransferase (TagB/SpsB family)